MVEPFLYGSVFQLIVGAILFIAAGFLSCKALMGKIGRIETILFSLVLGALLPSMLILLLNFVFGLKMDFIAVAACFVVVAVASFGWMRFKRSAA